MEITQAFVLGAGLGTRLRPLTDDLPKPLVPIFQKPLITFAFDHLIDISITKFFVNTHHRPERFAEAFGKTQSSRTGEVDCLKQSTSVRGAYRGLEIEFFHEPLLLETAGGIANIASSLSEDPLLIYNGDVLTDLPLSRLLEHHLREKNLVTMALRSGGGPQHIAFDSGTCRIIDIRNQLGTGAPEEFVFTGLYVIDRKFVDLLEPGVKRSVIPHFGELIRRKEKIGGVVIDEGHWWDVGNRDAYMELHRELSRSDGFPAVMSGATAGKPSFLEFPNYPVADPEWRSPVHKTAIVDPTAQLRGCSVVGKDCHVEAGAVIEDTILWPGAQIASRSELVGCIVRSENRASGKHRNIDI